MEELEKELGPVQNYIVAKELHQDGTPHYHAVIKLVERITVKQAKRFDVAGHHPNIQRPRSIKSAVLYCEKHGDFINNWGKYMRAKDSRSNQYANYIQLARDGKSEEAIKIFAISHPKDYVINRDRIDNNIRAMRVQEPTTLDYDLSCFTLPAGFTWDRTRCLILSGDSGIGKTKLAWALAGANALFVSHIDKLKRHRDEQPIIFDDMCFKHWPRESAIHLVDCGEDRQINVKHSMVEIKKGTPRIITTNLCLFSLFPEDPFDSIKRRVQFYDFQSIKLF